MGRLARAGLLADALAVDRIVDALIAKDVGELSDVGETRQVFQGQRLIGEKRCDHQRQRGILRPGNRDRAVQRRAAVNLYTIHPRSLLLKPTRQRGRRPRPRVIPEARETAPLAPPRAEPRLAAPGFAPCAASNSP